MALDLERYRELIEEYMLENGGDKPSPDWLAARMGEGVTRDQVMSFEADLGRNSIWSVDAVPPPPEEMPLVPPVRDDQEEHYPDHASGMLDPEVGQDDVLQYSQRDVDHITRNYQDELRSLNRLRQDEVAKAYRSNGMVSTMESRISSIVERAMAAHGTFAVSKAPRDEGETYEAHAPIADLHAGKYVWGKESWGGDFDTDLAAERLLEHGTMTAEWLNSQPGRCRRLYVSDVGDFWHALDGQTKKGTRLEQDTRAERVIDIITEAEIRRINILREFCDELIVKRVKGNHDHIYNSIFQKVIEAYFRNEDDVRVDISYSPQDYFITGSDDPLESHLRTAHVIDHGVRLGNIHTQGNQNKAFITIANALRHQHGTVGRVIFYCGHLHHLQVHESGNVELIRLPSMSETDDYETELRVGTCAGAIVYRLDERGRIDQQKRLYFGSPDRRVPSTVEGVLRQRSFENVL